MNARSALLSVGLAYGIWETVDVFWLDAPAIAVFAALFFACTVWLWRRDSRRAAVAILALCVMEAAFAPTLQAETVTKACDFALGLAGIISAVAVLLSARRAVTA